MELISITITTNKVETRSDVVGTDDLYEAASVVLGAALAMLEKEVGREDALKTMIHSLTDKLVNDQ